MARRLLALSVILALSFALLGDMRGIAELSVAAPLPSAADASPAGDQVGKSQIRTAGLDRECPRHPNATGAACSFDAVPILPAAVAPPPATTSAISDKAVARLKKNVLSPGLRPPISLS